MLICYLIKLCGYFTQLYHIGRESAQKSLVFGLVCSALGPFHLMVAMWNSYHTECLPNEAASVGGWAGAFSICLKSQMRF